jgi:ankyrin repeat protein
MNKFLQAIYNSNLNYINTLIHEEPQWLTWSEKDGRNVLHYLCSIHPYGDPLKEAAILETVQLLLKKGMDMNAVHYLGRTGDTRVPITPLLHACHSNNATLYTWLLKNGAIAPNCLHAFVHNDDVSGAELFQQYGHTVENAEKAGWNTMLITAYMWPRYNIAKWLLVNGASVDAVDHNGETVLFHAVEKQHGLEHIKILLQYGADPDKENNERMTPRKLAIAKNNKRLLSVLDSL